MTEVQRLAKIMVLKDMRKEYELRAKYNGGVDYDCYRALDMAIEELEQQPCTDAISRQAVIDIIEEVCPIYGNDYRYILRDKVNELPPVNPAENPNKWIPLTKRPMTDEEREDYREWSDIEGAMIFDCPLPEDGQEVLVSYGGYVMVDTFCKDDGCYFEGVDIDDVEAWMPLPEPYKASPTGAERSDKE